MGGFGIAGAQLAGVGGSGSIFKYETMLGPGITDLANATSNGLQFGGGNTLGGSNPLTVRGWRFPFNGQLSFNQITINARNFNTGGGNVAFALYDVFLNKVWESGSINIPNLANFASYKVSVADFVVNPGVYYLAQTSDNLCFVVGWDFTKLTVDNNTSSGNLINQSAPFPYAISDQLATEIGSNITMPAGLGNLTVPPNDGVTCPAIFFQHV